MLFERLEKRRLFAVTVGYDTAMHNLLITGDGSGQEITVAQSGMNLTITETGRSPIVRAIPADTMFITLDGAGGDDTLRIDASVVGDRSAAAGPVCRRGRLVLRKVNQVRVARRVHRRRRPAAVGRSARHRWTSADQSRPRPGIIG